MAKLFRKRRKSMKTVLGVTKAKRSLSRATGIPTSKAGRKRKTLNSVTGGTYGRYTRTRAKVLRPYKTAKRYSGGCLVSALSVVFIVTLGMALVVPVVL